MQISGFRRCPERGSIHQSSKQLIKHEPPLSMSPASTLCLLILGQNESREWDSHLYFTVPFLRCSCIAYLFEPFEGIFGQEIILWLFPLAIYENHAQWKSCSYHAQITSWFLFVHDMIDLAPLQDGRQDVPFPLRGLQTRCLNSITASCWGSGGNIGTPKNVNDFKFNDGLVALNEIMLIAG